jgi:two-component system, NarL family, nitrate/nitrite response regulator NarL
VRCLIVDDNGGFVAAARKLLEAGGITVVGSASSSAEAVELVGALHPDAALVDIDLGEENGLDLAARLRKTEPPTSVVLVSAYSPDDFLESIDSCGAAGFVPKSQLTASAVREVLERLSGTRGR